MSESRNSQQYNSANINEDFPTKITESKIISKRAEEICVQQKFNRLKSSEDDALISMDAVNPTVKKTIKTFQRKVIRKIGPNGEISEEIIESGDKIPENTFPETVSKENDEETLKSKLCGKSEIRATYGIKTLLPTGEEDTQEYSTGPMHVSHVNDSDFKHSFPVGATVTKTFQQEKSRTVTHSTTVNGEAKVLSSKSTFLSISGKSDLKVKSIDEDSITNESASTNDQDIHVQNSEGQIQEMLKNLEENNKLSKPLNSIHQDHPENNPEDKKNVEINEELIIPVQQIKISNAPTKIESNEKRKESQKRLQELSKQLKFNNYCPNIEILDKQLVKEGKFQALEDLQTSPGILKKIVDRRMIKLYLIMFNDIFILAWKKSSNELNVIECCDKDKIEASHYSIPGPLKTNFAKQKKSGGSNLLSCASKNSSKKDISQLLFSLRFNKDNAISIKDPIILIAPTIENRDHWVRIISKISE